MIYLLVKSLRMICAGIYYFFHHQHLVNLQLSHSVKGPLKFHTFIKIYEKSISNFMRPFISNIILGFISSFLAIDLVNYERRNQ